MSEHCGYITQLENVRRHPNADRLYLATVFGTTVCVSSDYFEGQVGVYFPTDLQLSEEFCRVNDLVRRKDENGEPAGGYLDPQKRNVKTVRLRGEPSDGLFLPIETLNYCYADNKAVYHLTIGDRVDVINGHEICCKYIPRRPSHNSNKVNKTRKKKVNIAPLFREHADTSQLAYNLADFRAGDLIEITLKMHGTSQRTGYLPVLKGYRHSNPIYNYIIKHFYNKPNLSPTIQKWLDNALTSAIPIYEWGYVSGTRRTVLENYEGGYYGDNQFREPHSKFFEGKLLKGETAYYEVVGFTDNGTPIMPVADNKKINDKAFVKQYGKTTTFSYGCEPKPRTYQGYNDSFYGYQNELIDIEIPQSDIYVYRMTMTNEDGNVIEYTPDYMRYRCEKIGVKTVPVFWAGYVPSVEGTPPGSWVKNKVEEYYDGTDPIGRTHIREGAVVRIINRPSFCAYKHKNINFKILENIYKENATAPDIEEAEEVIDG